MNRRNFLRQSSFMVLGSSLIFLGACGNSSNSAPAAPAKTGTEDETQDGGTEGMACDGLPGSVVYTNPGHGHTNINLTSQQVAAATPGVYTLLGGGHDHDFTLTAEDFSDLQNGGTVSKVDNEGHGHIIDITC